MTMREQTDGQELPAELETALGQAFAVRPDPFRQVAIRAQVIAEAREMRNRTVEADLGQAYAVQPSMQKYALYRRMAIEAGTQPLAAPERSAGFFARAFSFLASGETSFERRLNDCIEAVVAGRATTNDCLQQYPQDADRLAPLLGLAQGLRTEYASLPLDQRVSGVRWRVLRAAREPQTRPLAAETTSGGGFFKHLQWAAPLTTGVAASFILTFLAFQALTGGSGSPTGPTGGQVVVAPTGEPLDYGALVEVAEDNPTLNRVRLSVERVRTAVDNNEAPSREELEELTQSTQALNENINDLGNAELGAARQIAEIAVTTLAEAETLVADEDAEALVSSVEAVNNSRTAAEGAVEPASTPDEPEPTATADPEPTEDPEPTPTATPEPPDLEALLATHAEISEALPDAAGEGLDAALLEDYNESAAALILALESPEGSADAEFIITAVSLAGSNVLRLTAVENPGDESELALLDEARDTAQQLAEKAVAAKQALEESLTDAAAETLEDDSESGTAAQ